MTIPVGSYTYLSCILSIWIKTPTVPCWSPHVYPSTKNHWSACYSFIPKTQNLSKPTYYKSKETQKQTNQTNQTKPRTFAFFHSQRAFLPPTQPAASAPSSSRPSPRVALRISSSQRDSPEAAAKETKGGVFSCSFRFDKEGFQKKIL